MRFKNLGLGAKIFGGFIIVVVIALGIGGASYFTLEKVVKEAEISDLSHNIRQKLEQARSHEKNYIIRKDQKSYDDLLGTLEAIDSLLIVLESKGDKNADIEGIREAKEKYVKAAAEMRQATLENAGVLTQLQSTAENITKISGQESQKVITETHQTIVEADKKALKQNALKEIRSIVDVGYQVLEYYHNVGISQSAMLAIIRNLHFDETNYYFVVQEDLTLVAHGANQKLEGLDFGTIQDKKTGKTFMRELVKGAMENGESFTEYFWTKPGMGDAVFPKITYSKYFKPWGIIICAGIYLEDIESQVNQMQTMLNEGLNKLQEANRIEILAQKARVNALYYMIFKENADRTETYLNDLKELNVATAELKTTADLYGENFEQWTANDENIRTQIDATEKIAIASLQASENLSDSAKERFNKGALNGKRTIGLFIVIVAVAGLGCALLLKQNITRPIHRAIESVMNSSDQLSAASTQVSSASQSLAEGAAQQAASIEETSSSLEEMASMTKQNAANATQADNLMREANNIFLQSKERMDELTRSMQDITKASEETQKIIKTIDEIAFQTNLLALNAAVEAARAGEAGAGFAVVADEVRNLAMRAADAAKHTTGLIEGSVRKIKEGSELVIQTNQAFTEVAASASKVGQLVAEINAASNEQSEGVDQINKAVTEMDKITQSNAANAEESAAASEELNSQAEAMKNVVNGLVAIVGRLKSKKAAEDKEIVKKSPQASTISQEQSYVAKAEKIKSYRKDEKIETAENVIPFNDGFEDF